jgi:hypothetical protein
MVTLDQSGKNVTGYVFFHRCPGGGRVAYRLTGQEQPDGSFAVSGRKSGGRGGLYRSSAGSLKFTLTHGKTPKPSY